MVNPSTIVAIVRCDAVRLKRPPDRTERSSDKTVAAFMGKYGESIDSPYLQCMLLACSQRVQETRFGRRNRRSEA
jgi:hypothetical protein